MRRLFARLAAEEYRAFSELGRGKSANERFTGLWRSDRNQAKWLLLGFLPSLPLLVADEFGFDRTALWYGWAVVAGLWFALMAGTMLFVAGKAFKKSLVRKNG